ncbi:MAG TPA: phenylacetate--CoA ligase family protein [Phycisphaerae bacterium]|nr:phenylacetate--CoA ligase family protein [Phycisphaerae bacterium]HRR85203.1 phenylacetate--CoA ligase family protein [Phycisphaerae bacterium]
MNRWFAGQVFWPLTERLCRRDTMRRLAELNRTQHLPPEVICEIQERKLRRLLSTASEHCPFHSRRIRQAGIDANDPRLGLSALGLLPLLTREDIREHRDEMTWFGCPRGGPRLYNTGGSSGEPLKFYFDRFRQAADGGARWRARQWWGVQPGDPEILLWGAPIELAANDRLRRWRDALLNQYVLNAFDMTDTTMDAYIDRIRAVRPVCLYGYAGSLALLSRHALTKGLAPGSLGSPRLRAVFVTGEVLVEPDREVIASAFGAPVVIEYGCRDGGLLALGCPAGRLHIPQENVVIELLDEQGEPIAAGDVGEVVVTHLETRAMPLIRYRTGDLARAWPVSGGQCECGVSLAALAEVRGRLTDQIVCRAGGQIRRMHALALIYVLREVDGIRQFRITQRSLDELDVEVVPTARFSVDSERAILLGLHRRLGSDVRIRLNRRDHIPATASGKHACVISQVGQELGPGLPG